MLQLAMLEIHPGENTRFEATFAVAAKLLSPAPGYVAHRLTRCVESPSRYALLIDWRTLEDHTIAFRESPEHLRWLELLRPFYAAPVRSVHFETVG